jgi:hypothetical protein
VPAKATVTITCAPPLVINAVLPVAKADGSGSPTCPSQAEMDAITQAYVDALKAQPGVTAVTRVFATCEWIVSARAAGLGAASTTTGGPS